VQQDTNGPFAESARIQEDIKYRMALVPGVAQASPLSFQTVQIDRMGKPFRFFVIGYDLNGLGRPPIVIDGRNIRQKHYEMVVSKGMKMGIGEKIHLGLHNYTVVGITGKIVSSGGDPVVYVTLSDAQEIQFKYDNDAIRNDRERVSSWVAGIQTLSSAQAKSLTQNITELKESTHTINAVVVKLNPGANLTKVQERIVRWNHYRAISDEEQSKILSKGMIEKARMQLGLFSIILLIISAVIISLIIYTSTLDKIKVIATLKLMGARNRVIIGMILQQSLLMGIIAYGIGYVLIKLTYEKFPRRIELIPFDLYALFAIVIAICMISSFVGIRKALKVEPAQALGG
jgi:putative ABC transport system permease protein